MKNDRNFVQSNKLFTINLHEWVWITDILYGGGCDNLKLEQNDIRAISKYLRLSLDSLKELREVMIEIEINGEVDHDGQPVMNSEELNMDIRNIERLLNMISEAEGV